MSRCSQLYQSVGRGEERRGRFLFSSFIFSNKRFSVAKSHVHEHDDDDDDDEDVDEECLAATSNVVRGTLPSLKRKRNCCVDWLLAAQY